MDELVLRLAEAGALGLEARTCMRNIGVNFKQ